MRITTFVCDRSKQYSGMARDSHGVLSRLQMIIAVGALLLGPFAAQASQRTGEGLVAAVTGEVHARYYEGRVHHGRTEQSRLFQGASVGERTVITTGNNGHACIVLTPGALLHIPPNTRMEIQELRHAATGLPRSENDLVRRIRLNVDRGRVYVNAGTPTPSLDLQISLPVGQISAQGGTFSLAAEEGDEWSVVALEYELDVTPSNGDQARFSAGDSGRVTSGSAELTRSLRETDRHEFRLCAGYFRDIEAFRHHLLGFDVGGVSGYLGLADGPILLGTEAAIADVSPTFPPAQVTSATAPAPPPAALPDGRRWGERRIWDWWEQIGVIRGVNYVPSYAVNCTEIWMEDTFDPDVIDRELGWAQSLGFTSVRVQLQFQVWQADPVGFLDRMNTFLDLADRNGLTVVPVLFDDLNMAQREPSVGPQPDPVPGAHNAQWTPSPGPSIVQDQAQWDELEEFTRAVVRKFQRDRRVLYWDLYNTAGNDGLWELSLPFMDQAFNWVRDINPRQPVAVPAWRELNSPMAARKLERSDLITFHSFESPEMVEAKIQLLQRHDRPIIVSDWLMRQQRNDFENLLPIYSQYGVGWFSRGLVQGRTQMWIQQEGFQSEEHPDVWQHDVLTVDGEPFSEREVELIRSFSYLEGQTL